MSCSNYHHGAIVVFVVCVICNQFNTITTNAIHINNNNNHDVRRLTGKMVFGQNDGPNPYNDNQNIHFNNNNNNNKYNTYQQLHDRSSGPTEAELYGYAQLANTGGQPQQQQRPQQQNADQFLFNGQPSEDQLSSYQQMFDGLKLAETMLPSQPFPTYENPNPSPADGETVGVIKKYLKKYDLKNYFLKKILGDKYESEEGHDSGFFANQHLRRHGAAGMAGKVFGELIGIKVRKTIEGFGDTISDYAKDFTANGLDKIGDTFAKLFRGA